MAANTKMATAVQILCVIAYRMQQGTTAEQIAQSLDTNPVVVRRILKGLERHGLVNLRPGKTGGVRLAVEPAFITLEQIYYSVNHDEQIFALRSKGNPQCPVDNCIDGLLQPVFNSVLDAVGAKLRETTLATLVENIG